MTSYVPRLQKSNDATSYFLSLYTVDTLHPVENLQFPLVVTGCTISPPLTSLPLESMQY